MAVHPQIERVFRPLMERLGEVEPGFAVFLTPAARNARFPAGCSARFCDLRARGYCQPTDPPTIVYRPCLAREPVHRIEGVLAHELAHALFFTRGRPHHSEREADALAEQVFGLRLYYAPPLYVQSTAHGLRPRPSWLG